MAWCELLSQMLWCSSQTECLSFFHKLFAVHESHSKLARAKCAKKKVCACQGCKVIFVRWLNVLVRFAANTTTLISGILELTLLVSTGEGKS